MIFLSLMPEIVDISKAVQDLMRIQSNPERLSILLSLFPAEALRFPQLCEKVGDLRNTRTPGSTISHLSLELINKDLVVKNALEYRLSPLGRESVEAYQEYTGKVIPTLVEAVMEVASGQLGVEGWEEELKSKLMTPTSYRPAPALLRVMEVQSHPHKMRILTVLSDKNNHSLSVSELGTIFKEPDDERGFPRSTASNYVTELERALVVKRIAKGSILLTPVGEVSLRAFLTYQDRIRQPMFEAAQQRLVREFGIATNSRQTTF